jgi:hypothetical protein
MFIGCGMSWAVHARQCGQRGPTIAVQTSPTLAAAAGPNAALPLHKCFAPCAALRTGATWRLGRNGCNDKPTGFDEPKTQEDPMGFRFQKRIPIFPGVYLNLSKSGVSVSLGGHGATVNVGTQRRTVTLGIPGTGMSYRMPVTGMIIGVIVGIALLLGLIWLIKPDLIQPALHWWQPKIF